MQIQWSREALERLADNQQHITVDSHERAVRFIYYLIDQAETLRDHPKMGRIVPEIGNENIRELIAENYRIIYRVTEYNIDILSVFEGHRNLRSDDLGSSYLNDKKE